MKYGVTFKHRKTHRLNAGMSVLKLKVFRGRYREAQKSRAILTSANAFGHQDLFLSYED